VPDLSHGVLTRVIGIAQSPHRRTEGVLQVGDAPARSCGRTNEIRSAQRMLLWTCVTNKNRTALLSAIAVLWFSMMAAQAAPAPRRPARGWFAGIWRRGRLSLTDPVNAVVYDPGGQASNKLEASLHAAGWTYNNCVNWEVGLGPDGEWTVPITSYSTDDSNRGCGSGERNHLRLWQSGDGKWAYIAVSFETPGCATHYLAVNAFNRGRDSLAAYIADQMSRRGLRLRWTTAYPDGTMSGIAYDGQVAYYAP
jgi:hypothetical protein